MKEADKQIGMLLSIACSLILLATIFTSAVEVIQNLEEIFLSANVDTSLLKGVLKIIGIAYVSEFSASICEESGCGAIASKVRIFGKITILSLSIPLISNFISIIGELL
ncbi:MAG: SpoIIIAC/SpoIIIAD family protein [Bacillota bacterium]